MTTAAASVIAPRPLLDLTYEELERELVADGLQTVHARTLWSALHVNLRENFARAEFLPPLWRRWVGAGRSFYTVTRRGGGYRQCRRVTRKFLLGLADAATGRSSHRPVPLSLI